MLPPRELVALDGIGAVPFSKISLSFFYSSFAFFGALDVMATSAAQILLLLLLNEKCHHKSRFRIPSGTDIRSCSRHRFESLQ